jgi:membrane protein implicated in regulation of membrane protease activity
MGVITLVIREIITPTFGEIDLKDISASCILFFLWPLYLTGMLFYGLTYLIAVIVKKIRRYCIEKKVGNKPRRVFTGIE